VSGKRAVIDPYSGEHADSIYAVWHDPTTYDHLKMGPPYLPDASCSKAVGRPKGASSIPDKDSLAEVRAMVAKEAANEDVANVLAHFLLDYGEQSMAELAALLTYLRALSFIHQTHHWQTQGTAFYADHLLFERLYNETQPLIDSLGERAVGAGTPVLVNPVIQSTHQLLIVKDLYNAAPMQAAPEQCVLISLKGVLRFLVLLRIGYELLEKKGMLSHGIDNLLQGIADVNESFVYLLKQRAGGRVASKSVKTASDWKIK
jgi:hypothetical protein